MTYVKFNTNESSICSTNSFSTGDGTKTLLNLRGQIMDIKVSPLTHHVGAEMIGINLAEPLTDDLVRKIKDEFCKHSVLLFRNQKMTPLQHIEFSRNFGDLEIHVLEQFLLRNHPEILILSNILEDGKQIGIVDAGQYWHSDLSYKENPSRGSILYSHKIPQKDGDRTYGDTCFVSTAAAFEDLDQYLQDTLKTLTATHQYAARYQRMKLQNNARQQLTEAQQKLVPPVTHPVVRKHPLSGRDCIYVNEGFTTKIVELQDGESKALLTKLFAHCVQEKFMYRHKWQEGDVLMWDNCSTQHLAIADYDSHQHRLMHRTTLSA